MNELAIIILNWNGHEDTIECIRSIRENEEQSFTIFLLDNGSNLESVDAIESWLEVDSNYAYEILDDNSFIKQENSFEKNLYFIKGKWNLGFAKGNNLVWNKIKNYYNYVLLLNNDTVISKNAISNMVSYMNNNTDVGVLSCDIRLYRDREKLWNAGGYFAWYGDRKYYSQKIIDRFKRRGVKSISTPFVTGCVMLVRQSVSNDIGVFTERFFFGEEDFNYCKRLSNSNIKVETYLDSTIYHKVGTSIKKSQKAINGYILHFSNRIINVKEFYPKLKWVVWMKLYILAIYLKISIATKDAKKAKKVVEKIKYYVLNYEEISYDTFIEINSII